MSAATKRKPSPIILGAGIFILLLAVFVYFAPRSPNESSVRALCRKETERQMSQLGGSFFIDSYRQEGLTAKFSVAAMGVKVRVICVVSGDARRPQVSVKPLK